MPLALSTDALPNIAAPHLEPLAPEAPLQGQDAESPAFYVVWWRQVYSRVEGHRSNPLTTTGLTLNNKGSLAVYVIPSTIDTSAPDAVDGASIKYTPMMQMGRCRHRVANDFRPVGRPEGLTLCSGFAKPWPKSRRRRTVGSARREGAWHNLALNEVAVEGRSWRRWIAKW